MDERVTDYTNKEYPPVPPHSLRLSVELPCGCIMVTDIPEENLTGNPGDLPGLVIQELGMTAVNMLGELKRMPHKGDHRGLN